ncbi:virulence-associated protein E, partial [Salmonella enterica subsp. enterica serovar Virchow]|nr:virulence-associated protein E [Salmonella enterica subsp. enterica serovar Virchow]
MQLPNLQMAARALGGEAYGRNKISCPGPGHSRDDRSLSIMFTGNGFVVKSFGGNDWQECRDYVKAKLGLSDDKPVAFNDNKPEIDVDKLRNKKTAAEIWARSIPITGTLAETYLQSRGLSYRSEALRFYQGGRAMVALITNAVTGAPQGVHRTFLDRHGKKVDRKMLGIAAGGVVRLTA